MEFAGVKKIGMDLYEISCPAAFYLLFLVEEHLGVGDVVSKGQAIATCSTECQLINIYVDFTCEILEVNQPFIDCLRATEGKDFEHLGFAQDSWIFRVQRV